MGKKKKSKKRGSREHGRGRKKGRGAGIRGGRGKAGADGHRKMAIHKEEGTDYFGSHGFNRPQKVVEEALTCNVGDLARLIDELDEAGHVEQDGDTTVVDLEAAGYDKLLGGGRLHRAYKITVADATDNAREKLEAEGGSLDLVEQPDDAESEETEASEDETDEPSDE